MIGLLKMFSCSSLNLWKFDISLSFDVEILALRSQISRHGGKILSVGISLPSKPSGQIQIQRNAKENNWKQTLHYGQFIHDTNYNLNYLQVN